MVIAIIGLLGIVDSALAQEKSMSESAPAAFPHQTVLYKTFNLLEVIDKSKVLKQEVAQNEVLKSIAKQYSERVEGTLGGCKEAGCLATALKWSETEIEAINQELQSMFSKGSLFKTALTRALQEEAYGLKYGGTVDTVMIRKAWRDTALGLNHILDVYMGGKGARYPAIDSISFKTTDQKFVQLIRQGIAAKVTGRDKKAVFYDLPVYAALKALELNGRDEAARYEPLAEGYNKKPYQAIKQTDWDSYPYSMILVLGHGPEDPAIALDAGAAHYCEVAASMYREGVAPFIVVSGGNVHPYKTPYNEAEEMKKYLVQALGIPDEAVFIEPHARHTTTNLRNVSRMIYRFNIPDHKPVLTLTNPAHSKYTLNIKDRCMQELTYLPFRDMKKISDETNSFFPVAESLRVNPYEPLDP